VLKKYIKKVFKKVNGEALSSFSISRKTLKHGLNMKDRDLRCFLKNQKHETFFHFLHFGGKPTGNDGLTIGKQLRSDWKAVGKKRMGEQRIRERGKKGSRVKSEFRVKGIGQIRVQGLG